MIPGIWDLTDYAVNTMGQKNIPVIWSYQNAARVDKPYIVLDYSTDDVPNFDWFEPWTDENGDRKLFSWRRATIDMQFYCGPDSLKIASWLSMMFCTDAVTDQQMRLNVSIGNRLFLQRMPAMLNTSQFEDRAIYQFDFYYTEELEEHVSFIDSVDVHGEYTGSLTTVTCDEIILAPWPQPIEDGSNEP